MLTAHQLRTRQSGIGSSEAAAVVGESPFANAWDVYNAKVFGIITEENDAMRAGSFLEDGVARMAAEQIAVKLYRGRTRRHATEPWRLATVDRQDKPTNRSEKPGVIVEVKTVGPNSGDWGYGSDEVPRHVMIQTQWQMDVLDVELVYVAAFFLVGRELRLYEIRRHRGMADALVALCREFWEKHVVPRNPPALDHSEGAREWLRRTFPNCSGEIVPAPADAERWAREYLLAASALKEAEAKKELAGNMLRALIGENAGIVGYWGKTTNRPNSRGNVNYRELAAHLLQGMSQEERTRLENEFRSAPPRVLRVDYKEPLTQQEQAA